jgi:DNA-binding response OmpR family regulator
MANGKILIVEDDFSSQAFYSAVLGKLFDLASSPTVDDAKQLMVATQVDLVIVDISLPGDEDGISLMKYIRAEYGSTIPIIAITAHAFPKNKVEALEAGASEFYTKPVMGRDLLKIVESYLGE